ncbi:IS6 family transposase [Candidatus Nitrospira salsa]
MNTLSTIQKNFKGRHFDHDIILLCVRWYVTYKLSYRDLVEMMEERGISLAHTTVRRWVQHYIPKCEKYWHEMHRHVGNSWYVDETYLKMKGKWIYLYRAVDQHGNTVDFLLSAKRDTAAATRFLRKAIVSWCRPTKLTLDKYHANHLAIQELKETQYLKRPTIRTAKCLTNRIERDHRRIKQRIRPMQAFQVFRNAQVTIAGIELAHQFRKEKHKLRIKKQSLGASESSWLKLLAA